MWKTAIPQKSSQKVSTAEVRIAFACAGSSLMAVWVADGESELASAHNRLVLV
jgi:hypothetical protein